MRELFDKLIAEGEAGIDRLIEEGTQETLQLDFKRKVNDRNGEFETNDRRALAEALSGFSNSAGGLIVFGIYARKGPDQIDCAQSGHPIADIRRFLSDAHTEIGRLVQPRLDNVAVDAIYSDRVPGAGYLLVYIPRSERRPHRSEAKGQKVYYRRSGDSFFEMEHYDIEDAFSRTASPELEISFNLLTPKRINDKLIVRIEIILMNNSFWTAKYPFFAFHRAVGWQTSDSEREIYATYHGDRGGAFNGGINDVIHPGTNSGVGFIVLPMYQSGARKWYFTGERSNNDGGCFEFIYGCEGMRVIREMKEFTKTQLQIHS